MGRVSLQVKRVRGDLTAVTMGSHHGLPWPSAGHACDITAEDYRPAHGKNPDTSRAFSGYLWGICGVFVVAQSL